MKSDLYEMGIYLQWIISLVPIYLILYSFYCMMWSSHDSNNDGVGLLYTNTMWTWRSIPIFWRNILPSSSGLMFLWNVGICLEVHMVSLPRRPILTTFILFTKHCKIRTECCGKASSFGRNWSLHARFRKFWCHIFDLASMISPWMKLHSKYCLPIAIFLYQCSQRCLKHFQKLLYTTFCNVTFEATKFLN
jgi:hypothetical protein